MLLLGWPRVVLVGLLPPLLLLPLLLGDVVVVCVALSMHYAHLPVVVVAGAYRCNFALLSTFANVSMNNVSH